MFDLVASSAGFITLLLLFATGAVGAVAGRRRPQFSNLWSHTFGCLGSLWGMLFATSVFLSDHSLNLKATFTNFPLLTPSFHIDPLSALFIFIISLVALFCSVYGVGYVKAYYGKYSLASLGFLYNLFLAAMMLVVTSSNALIFLIVWEVMTLASYFLVVYERHNEENVKAGSLYLVITQLGTAFILLAFILLYKYSHSFDFAAIKAAAHTIPSLVKDSVFALAFIGFGTKAGVIPFHIWLPSAHPAAPSHVSALMSGAMIKTGIYMMIRLFLDILQPIPTWWGITVLAFAIISCLMGVLYALTEHDIKRLLAFHSIENIGIILLGLGAALVFSSIHQRPLMVLSLAAALFHTLNHAVFKSLLFLGAGSLIHATHTRNMEDYGGLIKVMPQTSLFFLVGSMAISALPPFNGFFSEWLTFQSFFHGIISSGPLIKWTFVAAAAALALTGGLALACFVKAFGVSFLARPRSQEAKAAKESSGWMVWSMGALAALCLLIGLGSAHIAVGLEHIGQGLTDSNIATPLATASSSGALHISGSGSVSAPVIFLVLGATIVLVWLGARYLIGRKQRITNGPTWDCGSNLSPRMEITSIGFARSLIVIFKSVLKPSLQYQTEYDDAASRYMPSSRAVSLTHKDIYRKHIYESVFSSVAVISKWAKYIQNGNINSYIFYILVSLIIALLVGVN